MDFSIGDLYPAMTLNATEHLANPGVEDQEALNENADVSKNATTKASRPKYIWLAVGVVLAIVVFMGIN